MSPFLQNIRSVVTKLSDSKKQVFYLIHTVTQTFYLPPLCHNGVVSDWEQNDKSRNGNLSTAKGLPEL